MNARNKLLLFVCLIGIIAAVIFYINSLKYESTDDAYIESDIVKIAPRVSGQIKEVYVQDNQYIQEGYIIAKIDDRDYKIKLEQAQAAYEKALYSQKSAKAKLNAVNTKISAAKKDLDRYKKLYEAGAVSQQILDKAQAEYDSVKAQLTAAEESIFSDEGNKAADAELRVLKAQRDAAALNLEYTNIKAPFSGTVTRKNLNTGRFVSAGQSVLSLVSGNFWLEANFKENQTGKMKIGQDVQIKIDSFPQKTFKGRIESIQKASGAKASLFPPENASGSFVKIVQRIPVKIVFTEDIDFEKYNLAAGMSAVPKVKVKK